MTLCLFVCWFKRVEVRDAEELVAATLGLGVDLPVDAAKAADYARRAAEKGSVKPLRSKISS